MVLNCFLLAIVGRRCGQPRYHLVFAESMDSIPANASLAAAQLARQPTIITTKRRSRIEYLHASRCFQRKTPLSFPAASMPWSDTDESTSDYKCCQISKCPNIVMKKRQMFFFITPTTAPNHRPLQEQLFAGDRFGPHRRHQIRCLMADVRDCPEWRDCGHGVRFPIAVIGFKYTGHHGEFLIGDDSRQRSEGSAAITAEAFTAERLKKMCKAYLKIDLYKLLKEKLIYKRRGLLVPCAYQLARTRSGTKPSCRGKTAWCRTRTRTGMALRPRDFKSPASGSRTSSNSTGCRLTHR
ncbi:MAG: hypothetical protein JWR07_5511 [Nevskia sp.]|nr:hypothetical protein [Nevskia sp.]